MIFKRSQLLLTLFVLTFMSAAAAPAFAQSASGHGTLQAGVAPNGHTYRRQFTFSARTASDGTVSGNAVLVNPEFDGPTGNQPYLLQIDISCMEVYGNVAVFGGMTRRTNDPELVDAVFFTVEDNGQPGAYNDRISRAYFWDDDPTTTGDPQACQNTSADAFPLEQIIAGNISLRP
jgi:hypothetical protein